MAEVDEAFDAWIRSVALTEEGLVREALLDLGVSQLDHLQDITEDEINGLPIMKIVEKRRFLRLWKQLKKQHWSLDEPSSSQDNQEDSGDRRTNEHRQTSSSNVHAPGTPLGSFPNDLIFVCTRGLKLDSGNVLHQTESVSGGSQGGNMPCGHACSTCEATTRRLPGEQPSPEDIKKKKAKYMRTYRRKLKIDISRKHVREQILSHDRKRQKIRREALKKQQSPQVQVDSQSPSEHSSTPLLAPTGHLETFQQGPFEVSDGERPPVQHSKVGRNDVSQSTSAPEILSIKEKLKRSAKLFAMRNENSVSNDISQRQQGVNLAKENPHAPVYESSASFDVDVESNTFMMEPEAGPSKTPDEHLNPIDTDTCPNNTNPDTSDEAVVTNMAEVTHSADDSSLELDVPTGVFEGIFGDNLFSSDIELTWCSLPSLGHDGFVCHYGVKLKWSVTTELGINNVQSNSENNIIVSTEKGLRMLSSDGLALPMPFESNAITARGVAVDKRSGDVVYIPHDNTITIKTLRDGVWTTVNRNTEDVDIKIVNYLQSDEIIIFGDIKRRGYCIQHRHLNTWRQIFHNKFSFYLKTFFVQKLNNTYRVFYVMVSSSMLLVYKEDFVQYDTNFPKAVYIAKITNIQWACTDNNGSIFLLHQVLKNDDYHLTVWSDDGDYKGHVMEFTNEPPPLTVHSLDKTTLLITYDKRILAIDIEHLMDPPIDKLIDDILLNGPFTDV